MAAIWVVCGHLAVIPNNDKWAADIGGIEPVILGSHTRTLTTAQPPSLMYIYYESLYNETAGNKL